MTALVKKLNEIVHRLPPEQLEKLVRIAEGLEPQREEASPSHSGLVREGELLIHHGHSPVSPETVLELMRQERAYFNRQ